MQNKTDGQKKSLIFLVAKRKCKFFLWPKGNFPFFLSAAPGTGPTKPTGEKYQSEERAPIATEPPPRACPTKPTGEKYQSEERAPIATEPPPRAYLDWRKFWRKKEWGLTSFKKISSKFPSIQMRPKLSSKISQLILFSSKISFNPNKAQII
jgi:hypothetical protein